VASLPSRDLLQRLPKAELHCHLDGSVRPATLLELGAEYGVAMPQDDAWDLGKYMRVPDGRSLEEYLARFEVTLAVMQTAEALQRIARELAEDAARDGVWYLETRFAPVLNAQRGLTAPATIEAVMRGFEQAREEHGIIGRVIVCALRTLPPEVSLALARAAVECRDQGVVGFDLAGAERENPASGHLEAFRYAHQHGLACTCHAGEGDGADSVREAVQVCDVQRIGHGTRLIEDDALTELVRSRGIALEVCLTSNVQTGAAASYASHPLRAYFDRGLVVSLNTDNRLMSGTTLTDEYEHAARDLGFTFEELARIALSGFESAFLPRPERVALVERVRAAIAAMREPVP
jgi:adenosine deaminase